MPITPSSAVAVRAGIHTADSKSVTVAKAGRAVDARAARPPGWSAPRSLTTGSTSTCTSRRSWARLQAFAIDRARWCAASKTGCARTAFAGHGAQVPPLARRHPRRRAGARPRGAERRALPARTARRGRDARIERRRNGKLKIGIDIPAPDEMRAIIAALATSRRARWRPLLLTAIFTGLRASELRGLRWDDVDLKRGELHVRQRADRYGKIGRPKSEAGERTVPLPPMVVAALREHRLACPKGELDLVFPNSRGGIEHRNIIVERGFHPAQIAAGVVNQQR